MKPTLCTLFEGDYHLGAAVLINSLQAAGFVGEVVAGFRGAPPPWMNGQLERQWPGTGFSVRLVPLATSYHLTNYKPDFMLERLAEGADPLWYLDPDIVVTAPWSVFENWLSAGIALCEDVNSPLSINHPRRVGWRRYFAPKGFTLRAREPFYVNGGCIGLNAEHHAFLETWRSLQAHMAEAIGGLEQSKLGGGSSAHMRDPHFCFNASDQDALNAAIEASPQELPFSILGADAMGFRPGAALLPHALGTPKPWQKAYVHEALRGCPPTVADKTFWQNTTGPIAAFSRVMIARRMRALRLAAFIGRFYRRT
jgi:hypothetical protein